MPLSAYRSGSAGMMVVICAYLFHSDCKFTLIIPYIQIFLKNDAKGSFRFASFSQSDALLNDPFAAIWRGGKKGVNLRPEFDSSRLITRRLR